MGEQDNKQNNKQNNSTILDYSFAECDLELLKRAQVIRNRTIVELAYRFIRTEQETKSEGLSALCNQRHNNHTVFAGGWVGGPHHRQGSVGDEREVNDERDRHEGTS